MDEQLMRTMLDVDDQHWWYRGRREIVRAELDRLELPAAASVLDAGCGSGRQLDELRRYGQVHGIELNERAAARAASRGEFDVRIGRLEELPWGDEAFDLITCLDVIEHTPDDRRTLRELNRVCKAGGWLLVTVPAYPRLWSLHDEANHHYRRYRRSMLRATAAGTGWSLVRMSNFNSLLLAPAAAVRLAQRRRRPQNGSSADLKLPAPWLNALLERPMRLEARWIQAGRSLPAGLSLMAVLRKPPMSTGPDAAQGGR